MSFSSTFFVVSWFFFLVFFFFSNLQSGTLHQEAVLPLPDSIKNFSLSLFLWPLTSPCENGCWWWHVSFFAPCVVRRSRCQVFRDRFFFYPFIAGPHPLSAPVYGSFQIRIELPACVVLLRCEAVKTFKIFFSFYWIFVEAAKFWLHFGIRFTFEWTGGVGLHRSHNFV